MKCLKVSSGAWELKCFWKPLKRVKLCLWKDSMRSTWVVGTSTRQMCNLLGCCCYWWIMSLSTFKISWCTGKLKSYYSSVIRKVTKKPCKLQPVFPCFLFLLFSRTTSLSWMMKITHWKAWRSRMSSNWLSRVLYPLFPPESAKACSDSALMTHICSFIFSPQSGTKTWAGLRKCLLLPTAVRWTDTKVSLKSTVQQCTGSDRQMVTTAGRCGISMLESVGSQWWNHNTNIHNI